MKKRWIALCIGMLLVLQLAVPALAADGISACRSPQHLRIDGRYIDCDMYNINDSNYVKLRDLAMLLSGTESRFSVLYDPDENRILAVAGADYVPVGGELTTGLPDGSDLVCAGTQPIWIDGIERAVAEYSIRDNNYFRLRDLAPYLNFSVDYDEVTDTARVESADYRYAPGAGLWVYTGAQYSAFLTVSDASEAELTVSLRFQTDFSAEGEAIDCHDLRFVSADGKNYEAENDPSLSLRFDDDRAVMRVSGEDVPLVWAESPRSASSSLEHAESFIVRLTGEAMPVYGGALYTALPLRAVSFTEAEMREIAQAGSLPLPADLGSGAEIGIRRVSDSEYDAGSYRLIFEGDRWSLCDRDEILVYTSEGAAETLYFPAGSAAADTAEASHGAALRVTLALSRVIGATTERSRAKRYGMEEIGGVRYPTDTEKLDLSGLSPAGLDAAIPALQRLTGLKEINLIRADGGSDWSLASVKRLRDALPAVHVRYSFECYGKILSTDDEEIIFDSVPIGDEGVPLLSSVLDVLRDCRRFVLDGCGISNEAMASLRDSHPNTKVVWRVYFDGAANALTDETMLRLAFHINDGNSYLLRYFNDVTYIDVGHNSKMYDISFAAYMPELECAIFSGAPLTDISCLANCQKLVWLELCFCGYLADISVLAGHPTLKYLNISDSSVADISMLDSIPLERFNCQKTRISAEAERHFIETHPDCLSIFRNTNEYGYGWRYDDYGYHFFWYYQQMRNIFRYDEKNFMYNHKGG